MFRTLATLCILFALSSNVFAQTKYAYRYPTAKKRIQVGGVTHLGGARPYTPNRGATRGQVGAVTYLNGVRPYTPNRGATRGQVGAVTYLNGARPYTPNRGATRGQVGAVTYLNGVRPYTPNRGATRGQVGGVTYLGRGPTGYRQPQYRIGTQRGYVQPYRGIARP